MLPTYQKHEVIYFLPEQIVFFVKGDSSQISTNALLEWANDLVEKWKNKDAKSSRPDRAKAVKTSMPGRDKDVKISISDNDKSVLDFKPPIEQKPPARIREQLKTPQTLNTSNAISTLKRPYMENIWDKVGKRGSFTLVSTKVSGIKKQDDLLDLILFLDKNRKSFPGKNVQVVSPNWLTSGSSEPGGTGGPGGWPTPYDGSPADNKWVITLPPAITLQKGDGEGVVVAILDTAPSPEALDGFYNEWVTKGGKNHSLIKTLLDPAKRRLTVYPNGNLDLAPIRDMQADGHEYDMTDHGLFVAGIIHSLVQQADLHLFRVLNRYGVGDLLDIAQALQLVYMKSLNTNDNFSKKKLVVNLSLTLNIPLEDGHLNDLGSTILHSTNSRYESSFCKMIQSFISWICRLVHGPSWLERQAWPLEWICDLIPALGSGVIAAAGNNYDARKQTERPQACYPAAFESVVGVGALPKRKAPLLPAEEPIPASYSNLADRPPRAGITTLGGEEGVGEGVLGIYLGNFPDKSPNNSGWAWWCGTSFATPIISGMTAAVLSGNPGITTEGAIQALYDRQAFWTGSGEDVLEVTQG